MEGAQLWEASPGTDDNYCQDKKEENALVEWPAKEQGPDPRRQSTWVVAFLAYLCINEAASKSVHLEEEIWI